ncbi:MAG: hypothetical protein ABS882_07210 [Lysinibacillus sp.]
MIKIYKVLILLAFAVVLLLPADKANAITSYGSAVNINVNTEYKGTLPSSSTDHFYKFTIPANGKVELTIKNVPGAKWSGKIVNSQGTTIDTVTSENGSFANGWNKTFTGLAAGTYYAVIENYSSAVGKPYAFSVDYTTGNYYEKEQNNTLTTANQIEVNKQYEGVIHDYNDEDFYKFTLHQSGNVKFSMNNVPHAKWYARLYNSNGDKYAEFYTNDSELVLGKSAIEVGLPKGTYYIKINNYTSSVDVPYKMTVGFTKSDLYEKEFNNTVATATSFKLNNSYKGSLQGYNDTDFYKFTLNGAGNVNLSMSTLEGASWRVLIQNAKGVIVESFTTKHTGVTSKVATVNVGLPKGTYYVNISNSTSTIYKPYTLKINFKASSNGYEKEPNNTFTTATPIPLNTTVNGVINNHSSDKDYYKFVVPASGNMKFSLPQKPGISWYYTVYDSKGNRISSGYTNGNDFAKGFWTSTLYLKKGTYYFYVSNSNNSRLVPYTVKISQTTATPAAKNVVIKNNKGKADTITVKGVKKGSTIKVYNSKSKQIASVKAKGTTATLTVKQLGKQAGKVYVTVQEPGKLVSARRTVNFARER